MDKDTATIVASARRVTTRIEVLRWMATLPKVKQTRYELDWVLDNMLKGDYIIWNSNSGFRLYLN